MASFGGLGAIGGAILGYGLGGGLGGAAIGTSIGSQIESARIQLDAAKKTEAYRKQSMAMQRASAAEQKKFQDIKINRDRFETVRRARKARATAIAVGLKQSGSGAFQSSSTLSAAGGAVAFGTGETSFLNQAQTIGDNIYDYSAQSSGFMEQAYDAKAKGIRQSSIFDMAGSIPSVFSQYSSMLGNQTGLKDIVSSMNKWI